MCDKALDKKIFPKNGIERLPFVNENHSENYNVA